MAARCESACKNLNASIVVSEDAYQQLRPAEKPELTPSFNVPIRGIGEVCLYTIENPTTDTPKL
jgi:hypothetical protein